jgi:hypothetical protein
MKLAREVPSWKLVLLALCLLLAPQSLKDCGNNFFFPKHVTLDFFTTLLIMVGTLFLAWFLMQYLSGNRHKAIVKMCTFFEDSIFRKHYVQTILYCSIFVLVMASLISFAIYEYVPRVSDEIAQLFQARIFLSGHLTAPSPPLPEFFTYAEDNIIVTPRWYSQYPPGFPFLLMTGLWIGSPWIINPLLAALSVALLFLLCQQIFDRETAVLSAILFALSPKVLFTSGSLMNHTAAMFFLLLAVTSMVFSVRRQNALLALCSGISLGISLNIRTLDAVLLFLPVGIYSLLMCFKKQTVLKIGSAWLCGFLMMGLTLLFYNYYTTGGPLLFGYIVRWGESHYLGFHKIRGGRIHTPLLGLINTILQIRLTDKGLLEWVIPVSFFILMVLLFVRKTIWDWIFLSIILLNILLYFFWGWVDQLFMGRFYFSVTPYFIILAARGLQCLVKMFSGNSNSDQLGQEIKQPFRALLIVGLFIIISIPVRAGDFGLQYNVPHLQVDRSLYQTVKQQNIHDAIVFIEPQDRQELIVGCGFFMNTPDLNSQDIIFAKDLGEKNKELLKQYPERKGFMYQHRRQTKKTFDKGYCISPPESFELVAIDGR